MEYSDTGRITWEDKERGGRWKEWKGKIMPEGIIYCEGEGTMLI